MDGVDLAGGALGFALLAAGGLLGLKDGARLHILLGCAQRYLAHARPKAQRAHALPIAGLLLMRKMATPQTSILCVSMQRAAHKNDLNLLVSECH